ncbi:hypothetical protein B4168_1264 [Anoxybacillus flavithermus]|nr:hypothetical protein B4168_1264 [Anoxybacillus flavithermus]OAO88588.1 hypothetical protein GT23_0244 [Parageobacillus thermoglucosidasius]
MITQAVFFLDRILHMSKSFEAMSAGTFFAEMVLVLSCRKGVKVLPRIDYHHCERWGR